MSGAVRSFTMPPAVRFEFAVVAVPQQGIVVGIRFQINAATVPAIAARRAAARDELPPPKSDATVSAAPRLHQNFGFVNKHRKTLQTLDAPGLVNEPEPDRGDASTRPYCAARRMAWSLKGDTPSHCKHEVGPAHAEPPR